MTKVTDKVLDAIRTTVQGFTSVVALKETVSEM